MRPTPASPFAADPSPRKVDGLLAAPLTSPTARFARLLGLATIVAFGINAARALPSFARQMNMACIACHTEYPELTAFGRQFKLSGYTMSTGDSNLPPIAVMLQPSFTHTEKAQAGGAAPGFGNNNNFALTQASVFYAGRLFGPYGKTLFGQNGADYVDKIGAFLQTTYDGVGKSWSWDNAELRYANSGTFAGHSVSYGVFANNNPSMEDLWNSTPAWGFPFTGSALAPTPAASAMIDGGIAHQVAGLGAYAMVDSAFYVDLSVYHTFSAHLQKSLGVDPTGEAQIGGLAPYWRMAWQKAVGNGTLEVGTFGLAANTHPGRDASEGTDRTVDLGLDSEYQISSGSSDVTATVSYIHEHNDWTASAALGNTDNASDSLDEFKATLHYLYDKTYGVTAQYFATHGSSDATLYGESATGSPDSDGEIVQLDYLPFNKGVGPSIWPRSNVKLSLQYVTYNKFNGARSNYDGAGANAHDNNTLYLEAWIAF